MRVTIQRKKLVKPKTLTPAHLCRHGISLFDQIQVPVYISVAFFYRANGADDASKVENKLSCLEESLSEVLTIHYPLAGRYVPEGCFVDCNDEGVEFIVRTVDGRLDQILATNPDCPGYNLIEVITNTPSQAEFVSPIVIRVDIFECGSFSICFTFLHIVVDLSSAIAFLKAWATICRGGIVDEASRPSFEVPSILPPIEWSSVHVSHPGTPISNREELVTNRFRFDGETLAKLASTIAKVTRVGSMSTNNPLPSRVEMVLGLVWKVLVKIDGWKSNGNLRPFSFQTPINLRGKTGVPTSKNAFGNLCINAYVEASAQDREMELDGFVRMVQRTIRDARSKYANIRDVNEFRSRVEEDSRNIVRMQGQNGKKYTLFNFSSWCGFGLYEIDFGYGKPELVLKPGPPFRMVTLMDGRIDDGGIDAFVNLDEVDMSLFKKEIADIIGELPQRGADEMKP